jgi:phosphoribosylformylglycinamidine synthase
LLVALAESAIMNAERPMGATVNLASWRDIPERALLFGEAQARFVLSTRAAPELLRRAAAHSATACVIGYVGDEGGPLTVTSASGSTTIDSASMLRAYYEAIPDAMQKPLESRVKTEGTD